MPTPSVHELVFGFSDAENYRRKENKDLFNKIFLRNDALKKLQKPSTFFLVGEKGTGKTAYAVYLSNSPTELQQSAHKFVRETDYLKFISLKKEHNLSLSEYTDIWKTILLLITCKELSERVGFYERIRQFPSFNVIIDAINEYYDKAFSPEIVSALQLVENVETTRELLAKFEVMEGGVKSGRKIEKSSNTQVFQTALLSLQRKMEDGVRSLRLNKDFYLFIDGVDIRPNSVPFEEYLDCVKGLANAIWSLNNDFFANIKDSRGRVKVVLLLRPDIFNSLGLQNRNTKLKDNSVVLNWITDYNKHRESEIFFLADRLFSSQQSESMAPGQSWDKYFPFEAASLGKDFAGHSSFVVLLRYSYHRPRDILTILDIVGEIYKKDPSRIGPFTYNDLFSSGFKEEYGNYLLGEIRDSLSFYYDSEEFDLFLKFFEFLQGKKKFTFAEFDASFNDFTTYLETAGKSPASFMKTPEEFLQFLYDQNVLCFIEETIDENFIRWCFRERSANNLSPKVKFGMKYEIHYGLANTLNTGKPFSVKSIPERLPPKQKNGSDWKNRTIKMINKKSGYGFIHQEGIPIDIYFKISDVVGEKSLKPKTLVSYELTLDPRDKTKMTAKNVKALLKKRR